MQYPDLPTEEEILGLFTDVLQQAAELDCAMQKLRQNHARLMCAVTYTAAKRLSTPNIGQGHAYLHRLMKHDINAACASIHAGCGQLADAQNAAVLLCRSLAG